MNENDTAAGDVDGDARSGWRAPWGSRSGPGNRLVPRWLSVIAVLYLAGMAVYQITTGSWLFAVGVGLLAVGLGLLEVSSLRRAPQGEHDRTNWALFLVGQWTVTVGGFGLLVLLVLSMFAPQPG